MSFLLRLLQLLQDSFYNQMHARYGGRDYKERLGIERFAHGLKARPPCLTWEVIRHGGLSCTNPNPHLTGVQASGARPTLKERAPEPILLKINSCHKVI